MGEFWVGGGAIETCRGMASAAHLNGKSIVGAESFTAGDQERWRDHPATIKALGDRAFSEGINRFVFHRFAMQPWLDRRPGMTMGPWGTHFERTETWWELTPGWHQYLARCQFLLRQGTFAADLCYLTAEDSPQGLPGHPQRGYGWDQCCPEIVLSKMAVQDGRLVLPSGMSYRLLVLSDARRMTPALLRKIKQLVEAGATVVGPRPLASPSLNNYPQLRRRSAAPGRRGLGQLRRPDGPRASARPRADRLGADAGAGFGARRASDPISAAHRCDTFTAGPKTRISTSWRIRWANGSRRPPPSA